MLGWLAGAGRGEGVDAPETPAPAFAYKAFKNALLGTPAEIDEDRELTIPLKPLENTYQRSDNLIKKLEKARSYAKDKSQPREPLPPPKEAAQPMASPAKSILVTPGTAAGRRKTVSFGEGVIDNERKRSTLGLSPKKDLLSGNISRQWPAPTSDLSRKNRSKPSQSSQSSLNAQEHKPCEEDDLFNITEKKKTTPTEKPATPTPQISQDPVEEADDDPTTNLNEPHSQSGKFWKAEYESYRTKSDREIKKLLEYRALTKSFARKKDEQVSRLTDKLRQEEEKLQVMEHHLAEIAAKMADNINTGEPKDEAMVKELSQQTALTLQHKHKAASLRRTLERHGVLDSDESSHDDDPKQDAVVRKLREVQAELDLANARLKSHGRSDDLKRLQTLVESSEKKARELDSENLSLKQDLAKIKKEISTYEGRRVSKEARLKRKQENLERRVKEYSERLRDSSKAHWEAQDALKKTFEAEKREMQDIIDSLRSELAAVEKRASTNNRTLPDPGRTSGRQSSPSKQEVDATQHREHRSSHQNGQSRANPTTNNTERERERERERSVPRHSSRPSNADLRPQRPRDNIQISPLRDLNSRDDAAMLTDLGGDDDVPPNILKRRQNNLDLLAAAKLLPPQRCRSASPKKSTTQEDYVRTTLSPRPSMVYMELDERKKSANFRPRPAKNTNDKTPRQKASKTSGLNRQMSLVPDFHLPASTAAEAFALAHPERSASAKARLQRSSEDAKKARAQGKENVYTAV
ncbi:hypothetical protein D8B26_005791 [Coccidioides posadasii str. Silveira]|uniref:Spindle pole body-associated protein cut12 domain-containing protein n=1 Tax=Coccidioides posadasii (strain RMSCC 757 / Silveira) TaxID=443226 RepID=E9DAX9_COCPS|nr:conserved hypothetical protein [Coccidioides posadasii str. Silveira]QVM11140.1 hypothetical protein D8B26_005791 [Coccidioides posadasii str. Silveira]